MDREVARLQAERGGEFDIKREGNLRDKLNQTNKRVKELEEELTIMVITGLLLLLQMIIAIVYTRQLKRLLKMIMRN